MSHPRSSSASASQQKLTELSPSEPKGWPRPWSRTGKGIRIRWRILAAYLAALTVIGWVLGSTGLYFFIKERSGYTEVQYAHVAGLPFTLAAYRQAKGEFWVKQGLKAAEEGEWRQAFDQLRMGLPSVPENEEARLTLARIYLMAGRPDQAGPVLVEGLSRHGNQVNYLRSVISFLFNQQADIGVIEMADRLLASPDLDPEARRMVSVARLYAYFNRDRFDAAAKVMQSDNLTQSVEGSFISARIAWETGARQTALLMMRELHTRAPRDGEVYRTLLFYLKESGRLDEARRLALSRQWSFPELPEAFVDYIDLSLEAGNEARIKSLEDEFLTQFARNSSALLQLAMWASRLGRSSLVARIAPLCAQDPQLAGQLPILELDALLRNGDYALIGNRLAQLRASGISFNETQKLTLFGLEGLAQLGLGQKADAQAKLLEISKAPRMSPVTLTSFGAMAVKLGDEVSASKLLQRAVYLDPLNQPALVELLRLELKNKALDQSLSLVEQLPTMRKPPSDLMAAIIANLESDRYLYVKGRQSAVRALQARLDAVKYVPAAQTS